MARKLKTYETSLGFFDLIAAPSMKAALEAWGAWWWRRQSGEIGLQRRNREFFEIFRPKPASDLLMAASRSNFDCNG
jgi:hypothetical protein